jgi:hypothetical protein
LTTSIDTEFFESFTEAIWRNELDFVILGFVLDLDYTFVDTSTHEGIPGGRPLAQSIFKLVFWINLELFPKRV